MSKFNVGDRVKLNNYFSKHYSSYKTGLIIKLILNDDFSNSVHQADIFWSISSGENRRNIWSIEHLEKVSSVDNDLICKKKLNE